MKLLFDQNLSPSLVASLQEVFPGSSHVRAHDLDRALDAEIWDFAGEHEFTIVTKDSDFATMSVLRGAPPKVVWVARGNCSTGAIRELLLEAAPLLAGFAEYEAQTILVLT